MPIKSLSFAQMKALCKELEPLLKQTVCTSILKIGDRQRVFIFEKQGFSHFLLFSFKAPFIRFHLLSCLPKIQERDFFLSESLHDYTVEKLELLHEDRILSIRLNKGGHIKTFIAELFPKKANCYLLNSEEKILYSLFPVSDPFYHPPKREPTFHLLDKEQAFLNSQEIEQLSIQIEQEETLRQAKQALFSFLNQKSKQLERRRVKLEQELEQCQRWQDIQHEGELLKTHFGHLKRGMDHLQVWDWEREAFRQITLDPLLTPQEQLSKRFKESKKKQGGLTPLQDQLKKNEDEQKKINLWQEKASQLKTLEEISAFNHQLNRPLLAKETSSRRCASPSPYHEFVSASGAKIWVGKSAKDNEKLTFSLARGSDWWLHVQPLPGSHIIIRLDKKQAEPDAETLADAIQLALYYSKAKQQGESEVCITQRKFVARLKKGARGQVQISKHRVIFAKIDPKRYQEIKERSHPP